MNKIIVTDNGININSENIVVSGNRLTFLTDGEYNIEYQNVKCVNLEFVVNPYIIVKIFEFALSDEMVVDNKYMVLEHGNLLLYKFYCVNKVLDTVVVDLDGVFSKVDYHFSNICTGSEDYKIIINHNSSNSTSYVTNRSIVIDGKVDFTVDSYLPRGKKKCVIDQDTKIINLDDNRSSIKPNMYINEDDCYARHASVVGKFSDMELFYLMSRGISYNEAIKLLVKGYIFSNLVIDTDSEDKILSLIEKYWR